MEEKKAVVENDMRVMAGSDPGAEMKSPGRAGSRLHGPGMDTGQRRAVC